MKKSGIAYFLLVIFVSISFFNCTSRVGSSGSSANGTGSTKNDVAFDPTTSSNLEVAHEKLIRSRLTGIFGLSPSSDAIAKLDDNLATFRRGKYDANYAKIYAQIAADTCRETDTAALFPELTVDHLWKLLTKEDVVDPDVKAMETKMLQETSGQNTSVKQYALCIGILLEPTVTFVNFIKTPAEVTP